METENLIVGKQSLTANIKLSTTTTVLIEARTATATNNAAKNSCGQHSSEDSVINYVNKFVFILHLLGLPLHA